jgi:hypothetical protein
VLGVEGSWIVSLTSFGDILVELIAGFKRNWMDGEIDSSRACGRMLLHYSTPTPVGRKAGK